MADQFLVFHLKRGWQDFVAVTWADAAQNNGCNKGSTCGSITALAPKEILDGELVPMNLVTWRAPSEVLGSNGSEVQAITIGEDVN